MHSYGVRDVEKLLRLPRSTIRSLVEAGFVSPRRGPRNAWRFSFQDLVVLRTARALAEAHVPPKRITRSIRELKRQLPQAMPLSGLSICAVGDRVVVREGEARWQAESGQYLLALESDAAGTLRMIEPGAAAAAAAHAARSPHQAVERARPCAEDLFAAAEAHEASDREAAVRLYARAIAADPALVDAHVNVVRLLHELGRLDAAERACRAALTTCGDEPLLHYNLGVVLEDRGRAEDAAAAYEAALRMDPDFADCLHNLALLAERMGRHRDAIRHMARYRRLALDRVT
jgi:tetratricopeptide (TPR) repeat protein